MDASAKAEAGRGMGEETCPEADAGEGVRSRAEAGVTAEAGAMAAAVAMEATVAEEAAETVGAAAAGAGALFDGVSFGSLRAKNRFVRAATWEGLATDEGRMTPELLEVYRELAAGGVGTILTGYAHIVADEQPNPRMMGIYDDSFVDEYRELVDVVHEAGARLVLQVAYGGSATRLDPPSKRILGPSAVANPKTGIVPVEASEDDLASLRDAFAAAVRRAQVAGFDGVELHAAHGYLLSQFLSPRLNRRTDAYGGSIENRVRFLAEGVDACRNAVGDRFPLLVKLNCADERRDLDDAAGVGAPSVCTTEADAGASGANAAAGDAAAAADAARVEGEASTADVRAAAPAAPATAETPERGLVPEESLRVAAVLAEHGIDAIEVSGDWHAFSPKECAGEPFFASFAARLARQVPVPVILTGGNRRFDVMERLAREDGIAAFGLCRPLVCEPDMVNRWQKDPHAAPRCVSCNGCNSTPGHRCILPPRR